ncbi:DUF6344 domain-containing protein [Streptomyces sp. NBC_00868]|uniref:DUF6344 domain-containing protein n=1 Tax=unclassified Streptomyces TaxID=2593676 RepID=UPI00324D2C3E|nr:DUF6344 domain-containing protein [Streptomyces sp. NBC_00868]
MAHRSILLSIWTSVLAALVAVLSSLGLAGKAAPAAASAAAPAGPAAVVRRPAFTARRTWRAMMRGGSLPPTIKQRIRAEAHGKTPSVRRSTTAAAMGAGQGTTDQALTLVGSAARSTAGSQVAATTGATTGGTTAAATGVLAAASAGAARDGLALAA